MILRTMSRTNEERSYIEQTDGRQSVWSSKGTEIVLTIQADDFDSEHVVRAESHMTVSETLRLIRDLTASVDRSLGNS
jgi:hypothetical protein